MLNKKILDSNAASSNILNEQARLNAKTNSN
jgi:hypothetical protein